MLQMNLQYFGGRGSSGGNSPSIAANKAVEFARQGKFSNGKTPSQVNVGEELFFEGTVYYKAGSNNWATHTNGASFTANEKYNAEMYPKSNATLSNNDVRRNLKNSSK